MITGIRASVRMSLGSLGTRSGLGGEARSSPVWRLVIAQIPWVLKGSAQKTPLKMTGTTF